MSRTRTLAQLRADVADRADIVDGGSGGRHPSATLNRRINQAIQQFRRVVTDCGAEMFLARSPTVTDPTTTVNSSGWAPCDYLTLPTDFYHLVGVDITVNGRTVTLVDFMRAERNLFKDDFGIGWSSTNSQKGTPEYYRISGYLRQVIGYDTTQIIQLIPACDIAYAATIWYLPIPKDLAADGDTFDGIAGYEEWVVNRAAMDSMMHDGIANSAAYAALQVENEKMQTRMAAEFGQNESVGRRIDTMAQRMRVRWINRWRPW